MEFLLFNDCGSNPRCENNKNVKKTREKNETPCSLKSFSFRWNFCSFIRIYCVALSVSNRQPFDVQRVWVVQYLQRKLGVVYAHLSVSLCATYRLRYSPNSKRVIGSFGTAFVRPCIPTQFKESSNVIKNRLKTLLAAHSALILVFTNQKRSRIHSQKTTTTTNKKKKKKNVLLNETDFRVFFYSCFVADLSLQMHEWIFGEKIDVSFLHVQTGIILFACDQSSLCDSRKYVHRMAAKHFYSDFSSIFHRSEKNNLLNSDEIWANDSCFMRSSEIKSPIFRNGIPLLMHSSNHEIVEVETWRSNFTCTIFKLLHPYHRDHNGNCNEKHENWGNCVCSKRSINIFFLAWWALEIKVNLEVDVSSCISCMMH